MLDGKRRPPKEINSLPEEEDCVFSVGGVRRGDLEERKVLARKKKHLCRGRGRLGGFLLQAMGCGKKNKGAFPKGCWIERGGV